MKKAFIFLLVATVIFGVIISPAIAAPKKIDGPRLERGVKNLALSWTEIPDAVIKTTKETKNPLWGITGGLIKGILNTFSRSVSGVSDIVSTPFKPKDTEQMFNPQMIKVEEGTTK